MLKHEAFGARRLMLDRNATKLGITLARTVMNTDLENAKKVMAMIPKRQPRATQEQGGDK
jgi:hypothetical protein